MDASHTPASPGAPRPTTSPLTSNPKPLPNPYRAKKPWPPNLSAMSPKHQFRLERRYRRRSARAYLRPNWVRGVKLFQFTAIAGVLAYSATMLDWSWTMGEQTPTLGQVQSEQQQQRGRTVMGVGKEKALGTGKEMGVAVSERG